MVGAAKFAWEKMYMYTFSHNYHFVDYDNITGKAELGAVGGGV